MDVFLLFVLKRRLKRYRRDAKCYEKIGNYNNYYHEWGIPHLEWEIDALETKIRGRKKK